MPDRPSIQPCQNSDTEFPSGVSAPMPVTTTRVPLRVPFLPMRGTSEPLVLRRLPLTRGGGPGPRPQRKASPPDILLRRLPPPPAPRPAPPPLPVPPSPPLRRGGKRQPPPAAASPAGGPRGRRQRPMRLGPALRPARSRLCRLTYLLSGTRHHRKGNASTSPADSALSLDYGRRPLSLPGFFGGFRTGRASVRPPVRARSRRP